MDVVGARLGRLSGGKVLDVGTGDGRFIELLVNGLADYVAIVGVDCDRDVLNEAKKRFSKPDIIFQEMSSEALIYPDGLFDTVCISNSLHHLADISTSLGEMVRVLKPSGTLIINEMFCDEQSMAQQNYMALHHLRAEVDTLMGSYHRRTYTKQDIIGFGSSLGITWTDPLEHHWWSPTFRNTNIEKMLRFYQGIVDRVKDGPEYQRLCERLNDIKVGIDRHGFDFATQLMMIGVK